MTNDNCFIDADFRPCEGGTFVIHSAAFRICEIIHQGSDSRIFSARSLQGGGGSAFVVKAYDCRRDSETWKKAMREIEAGEMLSKCPHIAHLHGYSAVSDGQRSKYGLFLLFDRMPCLDDMTVDTRGALEVCRDISLALREMSGKGLVHGDVKPSNIFRAGSRWVLGDLGSVCLSGQSPDYGSEGYCSPEAMRGEACDIRSDIYSLGLTLYKILSGGRLPFCASPCDETEDGDVYRAIEKRLNGEEIPPIPGLSDEVNQLMLKMCRFDRRAREKNPRKLARSASDILRKSYSTENH